MTKWSQIVLVILLAFVVAGCGRSGEAGSLDTGADLYRAYCVGCHANDGSGATGSPLGTTYLEPPSETIAAIRDGVGTMPGYADRLSEVDIGAIATYVRTDLAARPD